MIPTNRQEFKEFCLRQLGEPVIKVNVDLDQVDDQIDRCLYRFYELHGQATEEMIFLYNVQDADVDRGYIIVPNDVLGVTDVFRPNSSADIWSLDYQFQLEELYTLSSVYRYGNITYYYMNKMHLDLLNRFFAPDRQFSFNPISHKLVIAGGLKNIQMTEGGIIFRCRRKLHGEVQPDDPSNTEIYNIWQVKWLQDYSVEYIRRVWGQNMIKYQGVALIGGVTLNGQEMLAEANSNILMLEQQLRDEYILPPEFLVS